MNPYASIGSGRCQLVLLAQDGPLTRIVWHALEREFGMFPVLVEEPVPVLQFLRRRVKRLGIVTVLGQILFRSVVHPILSWRGRSRIDAIKTDLGLDDSPLDGSVISVPSVNSDAARQVLKELDPAVIIVSGTRILGKETLASVRATFINMHAGITPRYRGVHGGYWALAEGNPDLVGTTIHVLDEGIDTGGIIEQAFFQVSRQDSLATYPYLHAGVGIPLLVQAINRALDGELVIQPEALTDSSLRYHPTVWGYLRQRILRGVR
jgi:hypothetical protein